ARQSGQLLTPGVRVARVEAEADRLIALGLLHRLPEALDPLQPPGHRVGSPGRVLDQHRDRHLGAFDALAPVVESDLRVVTGEDVPAVHDDPGRSDLSRRGDLLLEQFAARNADPVVRRRHVEDVRRVDIQGDTRRLGGRLQPFGAARVVDDGLLPPLRVADEDLGRLRAARRGLGDRVAAVNVCTDQWPRRHGLELRCTHRHSPTTTDVAPAGARWRGRTGTAPLIGLATMTRILSALAWPYANGPR